MSANLVGEATSFAPGLQWSDADAATNAWMEPIETFPARFDTVLAAATDLNLGAVDLWTAHLNPTWAGRDHVDAAVRALGSRRLAVTSLAGGFGETAQQLKTSCRLATAVGTRILGGRALCLERDRDAALETLRRHGMLLAIENHPGAERPDDILRLIGADHDAVAAAVDTGWFATVGVDPAEAIRRLGEHVAHVHLKDVEPGPSHVTTTYGAGIVDLEDCVRALEAIGYDGTVALEHEPLDRDPRPRELPAMRDRALALIAGPG